jgi:hypothetical protein
MAVLGPHFIRSGERFINIDAIVSFEVLPSGQGELGLSNSVRLTLEPKEARWLSEYLKQFSDEFRPIPEFATGYYPVAAEPAPAPCR